MPSAHGDTFWVYLIEMVQEAFDNDGLELWVIDISCTTGIIYTVCNDIYFDGLKKRIGYENGGFLRRLICMAEFYADPEEAFQCARQTFI